MKDAATTKISLGMFILCSVQNFGYYGVMIWLPSYLSRQFGFGLTQSALWTAVTISAWRSASGCSAMLADRIGRRPALLDVSRPAPSSWCWSIRSSPTPTALLIGGAIMGMFVNGMLGGYGALMSELYPTEARATAQNVLFNLGRGVGGFGPLVVGALAAPIRSDRDRAPRHDLPGGHRGDGAAYPGTEGGGAGVTSPRRTGVAPGKF